MKVETEEPEPPACDCYGLVGGGHLVIPSLSLPVITRKPLSQDLLPHSYSGGTV